MSRRLAHSYRDELRQAHPVESYVFHWTHVVKFVVGVALLYLGFIALVILGTAAQ